VGSGRSLRSGAVDMDEDTLELVWLVIACAAMVAYGLLIR
jgi:hypothetical protein